MKLTLVNKTSWSHFGTLVVYTPHNNAGLSTKLSTWTITLFFKNHTQWAVKMYVKHLILHVKNKMMFLKKTISIYIQGLGG